MNKKIAPHEYRLLAGKVLNQSPDWVFMHLPNLNLSIMQMQKLDYLVQRRLNGEPIAKILGYKEFYGRNFYTDSHTLDPRADTETLIDAILNNFKKHDHLKILDLGIGTGCLLFTLLCEFPNAVGVGIDYSFDALKISQRNQESLKLKDRSILARGNWSKAINGKFDIIVCNPPYIATHESLDISTLYDPHAALFSGETGLEDYCKIIPDITRLLKGKLFLEIGKDQQLCVEKIALNYGLINQGCFPDLSGTIRVLCYSAVNT
jgi:release factor glutamine methyltransferase